MQISAKADYAVRALAELAEDSGRPLTCEAIATSQDIPFRFLKSVFRELRGAGLVRSQRGCEGGYWLARDPSDIALAEIVKAVDGDLLTLRGAPLDGVDYPGAAAQLPSVWREVEGYVRDLLARTTLRDLLGRGGAQADEAEAADAAGENDENRAFAAGAAGAASAAGTAGVVTGAAAAR